MEQQVKAPRTGRRTRSESEMTKRMIIKHAEALFSENSYEQVTLRNIASHSGVSHSLIRYHFGNKESIWKEVHAGLISQLDRFDRFITENLTKQMGSEINIRFYSVTVKAMAFFVLNPKVINFEIKRMSGNGVDSEYCLAKKLREDEILNSLISEFNEKFENAQINIIEYKWLLVSAVNSILNLGSVYSTLASSVHSTNEEVLFEQWKIQNKLLSKMFFIDENDILTPDKLEDLLIV